MYVFLVQTCKKCESLWRSQLKILYASVPLTCTHPIMFILIWNLPVTNLKYN